MNQRLESKQTRRRRVEVKRLVEQFKTGRMGRREFCELHGLSLSVLRRHLNGQRVEKAAAKARTRLVAVDIVGARSEAKAVREARTGWGDNVVDGACLIEVVLAKGRRIEVRPAFDADTLGRVIGILERV
jgi:hypothetical protein